MESQAKKASAFSQDVQNIQDIITGNAQKLGIAIAAPIGNEKTGKSDGMLGQRTSNALEQLVMLARLDARNKNPQDPRLAQGSRGGFERANMAMVEDYLKNSGVSAADVSKMMTGLEAVSAKDGNKPSLLDKHYTSGQVSEAAIKLPEVKKEAPAQNPAGAASAPSTSKDQFNKAAPPAASPAPVVTASVPEVKKTQMTYGEYDAIKDKLKGGGIVSNADKDKVKAFETALDTYKKGGDYAKAATNYEAAKKAFDTGDQTKATLEATKARIENDPKIQASFKALENKEVTVNVDGQDYTYSKAGLDKEFGFRWNDDDLTEKVRNAVDAKLESMDPNYKAYHEADRQLSGFDNRVASAYNDADKALRGENNKIKDSGFKLDVVVPSAQQVAAAPAVTVVAPKS